MDIIYSDVLKRLNAYRKGLKLSQQEMASLCGVGQSRYSKMESGEGVIIYQNLLKMYHNQLDVDYLITNKPTRKTVLNDYMLECPEEKKGFFFRLTAWALEIEFFKMGKKQEADFSQLYYETEITHQCLSTRKNVWVAIRNIYQISQAEMSKKLQISLKQYRKIEKRETFPDAEVLLRLFSYLSCRPSLILSEGMNCMGLFNDIWNQLSQDSQKRIEKVLIEGLRFLE